MTPAGAPTVSSPNVCVWMFCRTFAAAVLLNKLWNGSRNFYRGGGSKQPHHFPSTVPRRRYVLTMFFSQHILTKKGPLAKIWLAAHMHNKLTKAMVFSTNIAAAVARIITPEAPMALRLTSNLLLGVVRIFSRKAKYLLADSSDALARLKLAYSSSSNDLLDGDENANAITLHGGALDDLIGMPLTELDFFQTGGTAGTGSQSATPRYLADARDITIDEFGPGSGLGVMDAFGMDPDLDLLPVSQSRSASIQRASLISDHPTFSQAGQYPGDDLEAEPLIFTPSQQRTPSKSLQKSQSPSQNESVEVMRNAPVGTPQSNKSIEVMRDAEPTTNGTPRLSLDIDFEGNEELNVDVNKPHILPTTPPASRDTPPEDEESPVVRRGPQESLATSNRDHYPGLQSLDSRNSRESDQHSDVRDRTSSPVELMLPEELVLASEPSTPRIDGDDPNDKEASPANAGIPQRRAQAVASQHSARKRKAALTQHMDMETELSANFFRQCLHDTSDIVRVHKRVRLRASAYLDVDASEDDMTARDIFSRPVFSGYAPELQDMFAQCFDAGNMLQSTNERHDSGKETRLGSDAEGDETSSKRIRSSSSPKLSDDREHHEAQSAADVFIDKDEDNGRLSLASSGLGSGGPLFEFDEGGAPDENPEELATTSPRGNGLEIHHSPQQMPADDAAQLTTHLEPSENLEDLVETAEPTLHSELTPAHGVEDRSNATTDLVDVANASLDVGLEDGDSPASIAGDARMTARAHKMRDFLAERVGEDGTVAFTHELKADAGVNRRIAARSFYELLNLCSRRLVTLDQDGAYGNIRVTPVEPAFQISIARNGK
jgi:N terminus of Rad21 / Rec8 like protein/Conserved region of Rad21 / Rec8 like protein